VVRVALCVITRQRPVGLSRLLAGIAMQQRDDALPVDLRVVVVDNDPAGTALPVVERHRHDSPFPIVYATEPVVGIPQARNLSVELAGDVDLVGFVDDDEVPDPRWLIELVAAWRTSGSDVLIGPCSPIFEAPPPRWVEAGGFFDKVRRSSESGCPFRLVRSSGVLIDRRALELLPEGVAPFDERLRFAGGSDRHLFLRLRRLGCTFAYVEMATMTETVPASRARFTWLFLRHFRYGTTRGLELRLLDDAGFARCSLRAGRSFVHVAQGLWSAVSRVGQGRAEVARGLLEAARGAGTISGVLGLTVDEYRVVHGR
jgi:glycosyltransferase involved in cell wall biosynthesis